MTRHGTELYKQQFDTLDNCIAYCSSEQHREISENCTSAKCREICEKVYKNIIRKILKKYINRS